MTFTGWGNYPAINPEINLARDIDSLRKLLQSGFKGVSYAQGRSYGDSALSERILLTSQLNHFLDFNPETGVVECYAGVTIADLINIFLEKGWFPPVTPGTKHVSIGGAISSDVHGKNHHHDGCFSNHVLEFDIMLPDGDIQTCSAKQNSELFRSVCGGMGLMGVIIKAKLALKKIHSSYINETVVKAANLNETLALFEEHKDATYSVAWIDSTATKSDMGRSLIFLGEHDTSKKFELPKKRKLSIPVNFPRFTLNRHSIALFNHFYFNSVKTQKLERVVDYDTFFYPLDNIHNWNRMYGKNGFLQYQFVIPKKHGLAGLQKMLSIISDSKKASFLTVLKLLGKSNKNYLSFPMEGYTLALDFPVRAGVFELLDELDKLVLEYGGKIYLSKDARMPEYVFKKCYPEWEKFASIRKQYQANDKFYSLQSRRLGI